MLDSDDWKYSLVQRPEIFQFEFLKYPACLHLKLETVLSVTNSVSIFLMVSQPDNCDNCDHTERISQFCTKIASAGPITGQSEKPDLVLTNQRTDCGPPDAIYNYAIKGDEKKCENQNEITAKMQPL